MEMGGINRANNQKSLPQIWGGMKNLFSNVAYPAFKAVQTVLGPGTTDEKTSKLIGQASEAFSPAVPKLQEMLGVNNPKPDLFQPYIPKLQKMFGVTK